MSSYTNDMDYLDVLEPEALKYDPNTFINNKTHNKMQKGYKVLKLADLAKKIGLPSSKGIGTMEYLELVINTVEEKGLRFVQFLQLIDVLYVIVQKVDNSGDKIKTAREAYKTPDTKSAYSTNSDTSQPGGKEADITVVSPPVSEEIETPPEMEEIKKREHLDKSMEKSKLPWQK